MIPSPTPDLTPAERRAADLVQGLHSLADLAAAHPGIAQSIAESYAFKGLLVCLTHTDNPRTALAEVARAVPKADKDYEEQYFNLDVQLSSEVSLRFFTQREQVCERVVTGTREVTKKVPDPTALAAVPTVTVTETVEDVEWVCTPLLAETTGGAA